MGSLLKSKLLTDTAKAPPFRMDAEGTKHCAHEYHNQFGPAVCKYCGHERGDTEDHQHFWEVTQPGSQLLVCECGASKWQWE